MPRVRHPDWLHKNLLQKSDKFKQRSITDMFASCPKPAANADVDIEEAAGPSKSTSHKPLPAAKVTKRKRTANNEFEDVDVNLGWREALGAPPPYGATRVYFPLF